MFATGRETAPAPEGTPVAARMESGGCTNRSRDRKGAVAGTAPIFEEGDCLAHTHRRYIPGAATAISLLTPENFSKFLLNRPARSAAAWS